MIGEDVDISVQIEPGIWMIETDRNQFEQAIFNLAINARDAMPSGGNLTIEAKNAVIDADFVLHHLGATAGEFVCLSVCDTGTGMDEHTLRRIFEPFFTTKPVGAGTGLGLSMIYGFVRQSRGFVEASSTLGKGSRFQLYFPKSSSTPAALAPAVAATSTYLGSETILVVEDQEALLELTSHILSTGGYTVLRATDGESAVKLNREYPHAIDLALCDVVMPGLSGVEAARLMKQDRPDLKIIFMTGYSERALHSELSENVLSKPFTPDALFGAVRKLLGEPNESHEAKPH
jgi:CheY-like chemotaxis protein